MKARKEKKSMHPYASFLRHSLWLPLLGDLVHNPLGVIEGSVCCFKVLAV